MVITTGGGATKFPTKTRTRAEKQAGTRKLAAYREKVAARAAKKTETPEEYGAKVEAEKAAEAKPTAAIEKVTEAEIQTAAAVPSPVSPAYREQYIAQQQAQFEAQKVTISPHELYGGDVTQPISISAKAKEELELGAEPTPLKEEIAMAYEGVERFTERQITKGYAEAEVTKPSAWSIAFSERASEIAESIREREKEAPKVAFKPARVLSPLISESAARIVETAGMVPGGISVIRQEPAIIPTAIAAGAGLTVTGLVTSAKEEPAQFISDILVGAGVGYGLGKTGGIVSEAAPKVTLKTRPQEFLIKVKVPEAPEIKAPIPEAITQAEFKTTALGKDVFSVEQIQSHVAKFTETAPGIDVLVGETKAGYAEIYVKASEAQVRQLAKQFTGTVEQIRSGKVSYLAFEPTEKISVPTYEKYPGARIGISEPIRIGELEPTKAGIQWPFRLETKKALTPAELKVGEPLIQLSEATTILEARGRVEPEFDIKDYWKQPEFEEPLQLPSGIKTFAEPKPSFFVSEKATLFPKRRVVRYKEPTFIGEMPEMELRFVKPKRELAFKEPAKEMFDISQMQKLYKEAVTREKAPEPRITISKEPLPKKAKMPFVVGVPSISPYIKELVKPLIGEDIVTKPAQEIDISALRKPSIGKLPITEAETAALADAIAEPRKTPLKAAVTTKLDFLPPWELPKKKAEKRRKPSKKQLYIKQQKFTELQNPFRSFRDVFGFGK